MFTKVLPHGKVEASRAAQRWVATETDGMVAVATNADGTERRAKVCGVVSRLMQAHAAAGGCFATVAHGMRFVDNAETGAGSPCFVTATGAATGALYVYAVGTADRALAAFAREGVTVTGCNMESKGKVPGGTFTLHPDADADACMRALRALGGSARPPLGWQAQPLPKVDAAPVATAPEAAQEAEAPKGKGSKRGKRAEA